MESPQPAPGDFAGQVFRHRQSLRQIIRKARVEASGKRQAAPRAKPPHGMTEGAFGRDMNGVRPRALETTRDVAWPRQRQADLRIAQQLHGPEISRRKEFELRAERACLAR